MKSTLLFALVGTLYASSFATAQITSTMTCVENMNTDPRTFWIPIPGEQPRFRSLSGMFMEDRSDGTATMKGAVVNLADPRQRFSVELNFSGLVTPGMPTPPGSPFVTQFVTNNLVSVGGTIDTNTWRYYTTMTGTMTGRRDYAGAVATVIGTGPAYQIGNGANLFELGEGGSGWFQWTLVSQPTDTSFVLPSTLQGDSNSNFGMSCPCFGGQPASISNYGTGLAGCAGIPSLTSQLPLTGQAIAIEIGNANSTDVPGALLWSMTPASINEPVLGGIRLVDPIVDVFGILAPPGGTQFNCFVVEDPCGIGLEFYGQYVGVESCGPNGFSLSAGLQLTIGDL